MFITPPEDAALDLLLGLLHGQVVIGTLQCLLMSTLFTSVMLAPIARRPHYEVLNAHILGLGSGVLWLLRLHLLDLLQLEDPARLEEGCKWAALLEHVGLAILAHALLGVPARPLSGGRARVHGLPVSLTGPCSLLLVLALTLVLVEDCRSSCSHSGCSLRAVSPVVPWLAAVVADAFSSASLCVAHGDIAVAFAR